MYGKIKQCVCIKFCMKLGKSATETYEMLCEAFGEHSLNRTAVFEWHPCFNAVECQLKMTNIQGDQAPAKWLPFLQNSLLGNLYSNPIVFSTLQKHRGSHFP
jgi:hypothetical protein